jgi:hypothetical protein
MVDDKMPILQDADQWKASEHPEIMALKLELQQQKQESENLVRNLVAHVSRLSNVHRNSHNGTNNNNYSGNKHPFSGYKPTINNNYPPWMIEPPQNPMETKLVDRRIYTWCTKCRQGQGLWVCRHNTATHVDGYTNNRNQRRRIDRTNIQQPAHNNTGHENNRPTSTMPHGLPPESGVHLSLMDYLDDYLPEDESHANITEEAEP